MLFDKILLVVFISVGSNACTHDRSLEDPIRTIQNAEAMRNVYAPNSTKRVDYSRPEINSPPAPSAKKFEVADFNVDESTGRVDFKVDVVYFEYDDATLTSDGMKHLDSLAQYMEENPTTNLSIEGHCDHRGSVEYNLALGQRRSDSVRKYLAILNVPVSRLDSVSFGKEKPAVAGDSEEALAQNRRVEFAFKTNARNGFTKK